MQVEQVTGPEAHHGEGPVWASWNVSGTDTGLRYVDMLAGKVLSLGADGTVSATQVGTVAAALRPRDRGGMVVAVEREFALVSEAGTVQPLGTLWDDETVRFNDGGTDPDGRFYCGSMGYDKRTGAGSMWRIRPSGEVQRLWDDVTISNGLAWSPDGGTVYYVDTVPHEVYAFDYDGEIDVSSRRVLIDVPDDAGGPDGLTVDAEGGLWIALFGGSAVQHYAPDGKLLERIELPVSKVTACTFGGENLDELYITTSRQGLDDGDEPEAGAVFRAVPGVRGLPAVPFAG